jgi:DNA-binding MarR family transcriptional regulator
VPHATAPQLNLADRPVDSGRVPLPSNELNVLAVIAEKGPVDATDCARLADISPGITDAALRSLVNKGLATANKTRHGLVKKPDGTYSATKAGHAALAA